jgi:hypothetical protein
MSILHSVTGAVEKAHKKVSESAERVRKKEEAAERAHQKKLQKLAWERAQEDLAVFRMQLQHRQRLRAQDVTSAKTAADEDLASFKRMLKERQKARKKDQEQAVTLAYEELDVLKRTWKFRRDQERKLSAERQAQQSVRHRSEQRMAVEDGQLDVKLRRNELRARHRARREEEKQHEAEAKAKRKADQRLAIEDAYIDLDQQSKVWEERKKLRDKAAADEKKAAEAAKKEAEAKLKADEKRREKAAADEKKAAEKALKEAEKKVEDDRKLKEKAEKEERKAWDRRERNRQQEANRAEKHADTESRAAQRAADKSAKAAAASRKRIAWGVAGMGGMLAGAAFQTGSELLTAMGADMSLSGAMQRSDRGLRMATQLSNQAVVAGDPRNARRVGPESLLAESRALGQQFGFSTEAGLDALTRFTEKTGDLASVRPILGQLAELAGATGSNLEHVADAAAEASLQLGDIENKSDGIVDVLRQAAAQAKIGTIEFKNFASHYGKIVATSRFFANERAGQLTPSQALQGNQATLVALAQMSKAGGAGSVREQIIGVSTFMTQFQKGKRRDAMKQILGESIETADGKLKDPFQLLKLMMRKTGGKLELLHPMIQDAQAKRVTIAMAQKFTEAREALRKENPTWSAQKLTDEAINKLEASFNRLRDATISQMEVEQSLAAIRSRGLNEANAFNIEMEKFADELRVGLLPFFPPLLAGVQKLAEFAKAFTSSMGPTLTSETGRILSRGADVDTNVGNVRKALAVGTKEHPVEIPAALKENLEKQTAEAQQALAEGKARHEADFTPMSAGASKLFHQKYPDELRSGREYLITSALTTVGVRNGSWLNPYKPADFYPGAKQASEANNEMRRLESERLVTALKELNEGIRLGVLKVKVDAPQPTAGSTGQPPGATTSGAAETE